MPQPIFNILKKLEGNPATEAISYVNFRGIRSIEALAALPRGVLMDDGLSEEAASALELALQSFDMSFVQAERVEGGSHTIYAAEGAVFVNGVRVPLNTSKGLSLETVLAIYQAHGQGRKDAPNVGRILSASGMPISRRTVTSYLMAANLIPKVPAAQIVEKEESPERSMTKPAHVVPQQTRMPQQYRGSGAAPPSFYELLPK